MRRVPFAEEHQIQVMVAETVNAISLVNQTYHLHPQHKAAITDRCFQTTLHLMVGFVINQRARLNFMAGQQLHRIERRLPAEVERVGWLLQTNQKTRPCFQTVKAVPLVSKNWIHCLGFHQTSLAWVATSHFVVSQSLQYWSLYWH